MDTLFAPSSPSVFFFFNDTATTEIYTLSLHDALPISTRRCTSAARSSRGGCSAARRTRRTASRASCSPPPRSEEHTSELQSQFHLVCRLLLEKKKNEPPAWLSHGCFKLCLALRRRPVS